MPSYEPDEAEQIYAAYPSCDVWSIAIVKVYKAVSGRWVWTGITGAAVMASEKSPAGDMDFCYIHVLDLKTNKTVMTQELYFLFEFNEAAPYFYTFESNENVIGLSFADESEAADFYGKVVESVAIQTNSAPPEVYEDGGAYEEEYEAPAPTPAPATAPRPSVPPSPLPPAPAPAPPASSSMPPPGPPTGAAGGSSGNLGAAQVIEGLPMKAIPIRNALIGTTPAAQPKQTKKGSGGGIFKMFGGGGKKKEEVHIPVVGAPTDFKHESHIGWDPERGFEIRNIPPEWKALFQSAGIKKSELKDAETAKFIVNTVADVLCGGGAPPPPPPPPGGGPPPPPAPNAPRPPPAPGAPPPPGGGGGGAPRGGLLDQIRQGKELKKSEGGPPAGGLPDLTSLDTTTNTNLVDILSQAMMARRVAVERDSDEEEEDEAWD